MDIYCSNCDADIGLQTNEEFNSMKENVEKLQSELKSWEETAEIHAKAMKVLEDRNSELKRKLDLAVKALEFTVKNSGTSTDYNKKCALALKEIKEI